MTFDIREHIEFDAKGRAQCPSCLQEGKTGKNLSVLESGAYKCFRSCTPDQIRAAMGATRDRTLPPPSSPPSPPPKGVLNSPRKVKAATDKLLTQGHHAIKWLSDRGITREMIEHYRLGIVRAKCGDSTKENGFTFLPAIAIPIPSDQEGQYFLKKRLRPWTEKQPDGYKAWSQYGIPARAYHTHKPNTATQTWLCEGEWDAIVLGWAVRNSELKDYVQVSCFTCGAGNFSQECRRHLNGEIIVFYDRDQPGSEGAKKFQQAYPRITRIATVPGPQDAPKGWDVSDALNSGIGLDAFVEAAKAAIAYEPPKTENPLRDRLVINDEMLANAPDFTDWLVDDILTADELFLLAASPRAGKSLLALTLTQAVASGGKFLGRPVSQGAVIYIRCEDSDTKTKERELKQGWGKGLAVYWMDKFKLNELNHLEELVQELDARLVVFDTLSRVRDGGISESSAEMSQQLEPLQEMCKRNRCCGLLVHHTGKISTDNAGTINVYDTIRGSSAIRATCRGTLILAADERNYRLHVENGWGKHDLQVLLDANTLQWRLLGNWVGPNVDLSQKDRVLAYLTQVGKATIDDIAEGTSLPKRSLYEVLKRLQADEMIHKHGERRSAVYVREGIQHIQQLNTLLNSQDVDTENISPPIQQLSESGGEDGKSDLPSESKKNHMTMGDHFSDETAPPTPGETVELEAESSQGKGYGIQQQFNSNSTATPKSDPGKSKKKDIPGIERWMHHIEYDTVIEVLKPGRIESTCRILGIGTRRVPNTLLQPISE